ncbi:hypothetical protein ACN1C3_14365 [Pseudomonas sp. H11T01]|uniref:hypothetical protein n=1 Tax=Pseudomonas sp. H11T01 TaxID=3402749 RepID=UPI003ACC7186
MKITYLFLPNKRLKPKLLRQVTRQRLLQPNPVVRDDRFRSDNGQLRRNRRIVDSQIDFNALSAPPNLLSRHSLSHERHFDRTQPLWIRNPRTCTPFFTPTTIKIETPFMDIKLKNVDTRLSGPYYMTTATELRSSNIVACRYFSGATLKQATLMAAHLTFETVFAWVSMHARVAQRYKYRGTDFEVVDFRKGSALLCSTEFADGYAELRADAPSRYPPQHFREPQAISIPAHQTSAQRIARGFTKNAPRRQRIDRQPKMVQDIVRHHANANWIYPVRSRYSAVVRVIVMELTRRNQLLIVSDQVKVPSRSTLYRILRELEMKSSRTGVLSGIKCASPPNHTIYIKLGQPRRPSETKLKW